MSEPEDLPVREAVQLGLMRFTEFMSAAGAQTVDIRLRGMRRQPGGVLQFTVYASEKKPLPSLDPQRLALRRALGTVIDDEGNQVETKKFSVEVDSSGRLLSVEEVPHIDA